MIRGDFHHHINSDPQDGSFVPHSAGELIDRAAATGLHVLAITCHESVPYDGDASRYAKERGVLLLRGMEATVEAIRHGRVQLVTGPLRCTDIVRFIVRSHSTVGFVRDSLEYMLHVLRRTRRPVRPPFEAPMEGRKG